MQPVEVYQQQKAGLDEESRKRANRPITLILAQDDCAAMVKLFGSSRVRFLQAHVQPGDHVKVMCRPNKTSTSFVPKSNVIPAALYQKPMEFVAQDNSNQVITKLPESTGKAAPTLISPSCFPLLPSGSIVNVLGVMTECQLDHSAQPDAVTRAVVTLEHVPTRQKILLSMERAASDFADLKSGCLLDVRYGKLLNDGTTTHLEAEFDADRQHKTIIHIEAAVPEPTLKKSRTSASAETPLPESAVLKRTMFLRGE